jgi:SEC-C motif-containing protein
MRSRYAAYALGLVDYVVATTHPGGPQLEADEAAWRASLEAFCRGTRFETLEILEASEAGEEGWVTFRAGLSQGGADASFSERSRFLKVDGRWLYFSGERVG